ncbi:hypothetical protein [Deinococcus sp. AJ005]|uniref:CIS tube protein n=1 Tax=Deinococcus sp. AJ005 TaxID=2652443 RepID=UPI00125CA8DD|nr:hypothetical protein [Deinococcus sp. AJ005]QFP74996.1 hypothetical protein DAAJ005_00060 [Deinococcus sp. AJ005]
MERVNFLIESSNERISCLLNPEQLTVKRQAGTTARRSVGGLLGARLQDDDPLLAAGGGVTELELDLLFDTSLQEQPVRAGDVRELTRPLWRLAEAGGPGPALARVRFLWGKSWNVPGVILAISERFESFAASGAPQRSWLRMRLRRIPELAAPQATPAQTQPPAPRSWTAWPPGLDGLPPAPADTVEIQGDGLNVGSRLDALAFEAYGDPAAWRLIAQVNQLVNPLELSAGQVLQLPLLSGFGRAVGARDEA